MTRQFISPFCLWHTEVASDAFRRAWCFHYLQIIWLFYLLKPGGLASRSKGRELYRGAIKYNRDRISWKSFFGREEEQDTLCLRAPAMNKWIHCVASVVNNQPQYRLHFSRVRWVSTIETRRNNTANSIFSILLMTARQAPRNAQRSFNPMDTCNRSLYNCNSVQASFTVGLDRLCRGAMGFWDVRGCVRW